jgi:SAM-dependent methyltransferase
VVDRQFCEPGLAAVYDRFCPWDLRRDFAFYLPLVMGSARVLDVGCGTGLLLRRARETGHRGDLCGIDPAGAMLEQARVRSDVEWIHGTLSSVEWNRSFDLVVMTGHAFQVLVDDEELRTTLATAASLLTSAGRFAFETRNPGARGWEDWTPEHAVEVVSATGAVVRMAHEVVAPFDGRTVSFTATFTSPAWDHAEVSHSTLRFLDAAQLDRFLAGAGLAVAERFGDWDRSPLTGTSPEIITIAQRA